MLSLIDHREEGGGLAEVKRRILPGPLPADTTPTLRAGGEPYHYPDLAQVPKAVRNWAWIEESISIIMNDDEVRDQ